MLTPDTNGTGYIKPLTGIRAIAAFMVFFMHYNPAAKGTFLFKFFSQFYIGVSIFFVLSGFLITFRYYSNYQISRNWFAKYFQNRVARIYPLYFLLTTVTFLVVLFTELNKESIYSPSQIFINNLWIFFTNITFVRGFFSDLLFTMIPQGWSLTVEELFYFLVPLIWGFSKRIRLLYQIVILLFAGYVLVWLSRFMPFYGFFATDVFMLKFTFFGKCVQFAAGIWLAYVTIGKLKPISVLKRINKTYTGLFLIILSLLGLAFAWQNISIYYSVFIDNVILSLAVALFFWGLITERTGISRFLSTPLMDLLGKSSYAFYLIHVGVFQKLINNYCSSNIIIQFILLNIISILLYKWIETPLRMWVKAMNNRIKKEPTTHEVSKFA